MFEVMRLLSKWGLLRSALASSFFAPKLLAPVDVWFYLFGIVIGRSLTALSRCVNNISSLSVLSLILSQKIPDSCLSYLSTASPLGRALSGGGVQWILKVVHLCQHCHTMKQFRPLSSLNGLDFVALVVGSADTVSVRAPSPEPRARSALLEKFFVFFHTCHIMFARWRGLHFARRVLHAACNSRTAIAWVKDRHWWLLVLVSMAFYRNPQQQLNGWLAHCGVLRKVVARRRPPILLLLSFSRETKIYSAAAPQSCVSWI